jgi:uncharacterized membrane protein SpoIIM required for sporulation
MNDRRSDDDDSESESVRPDRTDPPAAETAESGDTGARTAPSSPPADPETEPSRSPAPDAAPNRGWAALALGLALVSLVTAGTTAMVYDEVLATAGSVALTLGFVVLAGLALTGRPVVTALAEGWAEHRLYVWFATALFAGGILIGAALVAAGVDLSELFLEMLVEEFDDEFVEGGEGGEIELSATFFLVQNTPPFLVAIFGALTLGLVTAAVMVFNGVLVGNLAVVTGLEVGFGPIVALLVPHGVFELPALFIASGVGFRFLHRAVKRIAGSRDSLFTKAYVYRTILLVVFGWLLLALAAFVEAYLTIVIAEALFPELAE